MTLKLYNTLTRTKEPFAPLDPKNVRIYVCGPTVYDFAHIGNARPVIVFDVLFRLLRHLYGESHVNYVRNITDIDDKINARAKERLGDRNIPILDVVRELTVETGAHLRRRRGRARLPAADGRAARDRARAADDRDDRDADCATVMPMRRKAMCCSTFRRNPTTASFRGVRWTR